MKVWLNGTLHAAENVGIAPSDRGFLLGDGLFETLQARKGEPLRLEAHLARLTAGAAMLGIPLPGHDLAAALRATLAANDLKDGSLRLTVTRGSGPRGVLPQTMPEPTVLVTAAPLPATPPGPSRCILATVTRRNEHSPLSSIKSLNYLDNILARQEAAAKGADDAILLNTSGRVAETTIANIFLVRDGRITTPPLSDGALPGIMRAAVLALGAEESPARPEDLLEADEIFLSNSLGLRPVATIDSRLLPNSSFPITTRLAAELI